MTKPDLPPALREALDAPRRMHASPHDSRPYGDTGRVDRARAMAAYGKWVHDMYMYYGGGSKFLDANGAAIAALEQEATP